MIRRYGAVLFLSLIVGGLGACRASAPKLRTNEAPGTATATGSTDTSDLVLVATTDFHAALDRAEGMAHVVRELRAKYGNRMVHLDGGDLFQGSLEGNTTKGRAVIDFYNLLGVDAVAVGNHDFDYGPDVPVRTTVRKGEDGMGNLKARVRESRFPWLSANIVSARTGKPVFKSHVVLERAGRKVCVVGATSDMTPRITSPDFVKGVKFLPPKAVVHATAKKLRRQGCHFVLLTAHAGLTCDAKRPADQLGEGRCLTDEGSYSEILRLLRELPPGTFDAVVAGHTHQKAQEVVNGTPVLEAMSYGKYVGVLHLSAGHARSADGAVGHAHRFEPLIEVPETASDVSDVTAALRPVREKVAGIKKRVVGFAKGPLHRNYQAENALGNLVADALIEEGGKHGGADFALVNAGGLRADLEAGTLTYGDVFNVVPFANSFALVRLKGSELKGLLEVALSGGHGLGVIGGLRVKRLDLHPSEKGPWDRDLDGDGAKETWERDILEEILDRHGKAVADEKTYRLATIDFLTLGADHQHLIYGRIPRRDVRLFDGRWILDVLADYISRHREIDPKNHFTPETRRIELIKSDAER